MTNPASGMIDAPAFRAAREGGHLVNDPINPTRRSLPMNLLRRFMISLACTAICSLIFNFPMISRVAFRHAKCPTGPDDPADVKELIKERIKKGGSSR